MDDVCGANTNIPEALGLKIAPTLEDAGIFELNLHLSLLKTYFFILLQSSQNQNAANVAIIFLGEWCPDLATKPQNHSCVCMYVVFGI